MTLILLVLAVAILLGREVVWRERVKQLEHIKRLQARSLARHMPTSPIFGDDA